MLRGVFPIVVTPFHDDGRVDFESLDRLVDHLIAAGAHGLGLFGNASEGYTLLANERVEMLKRIVKRVDGRVPLVVSSGHTGTDAAAVLSKEAEDMGASALMVLPPYLLKPDGDGLMYYFQRISKSVSIPIMVQDAPLMTGVSMPAGLLGRMAREIEHVRSAKVEAPPTTPKISALKAALNGSDDFAIFGGLNGQINDDGTSIETSIPGFQDFANQVYELTTDSACVDAATARIAGRTDALLWPGEAGRSPRHHARAKWPCA